MGNPCQYRPCQRDQELVPAAPRLVDGLESRTPAGPRRCAPPQLGRHTRSRHIPPRRGRSGNGHGTPCHLRRDHALWAEPVGHTPQAAHQAAHARAWPFSFPHPTSGVSADHVHRLGRFNVPKVLSAPHMATTSAVFDACSERLLTVPGPAVRGVSLC